MDSIETRTGVEAPEEVSDGVLHAQEAENEAALAEIVDSERAEAALAQENAASDSGAVASGGEGVEQEPVESATELEDAASEEVLASSEPEKASTSQEEVSAEAEAVTPEPESVDSEGKAEVTEDDKAEMGGHPMEEWDYEEPRRGQIRVGVILSIQEQEIIVDIGAKRDGIVPGSDLQRLDPEALDELAVGQEVPVYVLRTEDQDGNLLVSLNMARKEKSWMQAKELSESGEIIEDRVIGYNKGGLVLPVGEIRGFVPASQVPGFPHGLSQEDRLQRLSDMVGKKLQVKVIEINRRKRRLILSATAAQRLWRKQQRERLLSELREGEVRKGVVSSLCNFGAFVDLGGADGLIHLSELSWRRVRHPREVLNVGDEIEVYVLRLDHERKRIGLSLKRLQPEPWALVEDKYELGQLVEGVVTNVVDFGAFAEIEEGIEGLIHVSELAEGKISHPRDVVKKGDLLLLRIIRIDTRRKRLGLSLKRVLESEWAEWAAALAVAEAEAAEEEAVVAEAAAAEVAAAEAAAAEAADKEAQEAEAVEEEAVAAEAAAAEEAGAEAQEAEAVEEEAAEAKLAEVAEAPEVEEVVSEEVEEAAETVQADEVKTEVGEDAARLKDHEEAEAEEVVVEEAQAPEAVGVQEAEEETVGEEAIVVEAAASDAEVADTATTEAEVVEAVAAEVPVEDAAAEETAVEEAVSAEAGPAEVAAEATAVAEVVAEDLEEAVVAEELEAGTSTEGADAVAEAVVVEAVADEPAPVYDAESEVEDETTEDPELDAVDA